MGTTTVPAPVLKLRGGLAGLDGNQVATYASWLLAANSAVMTLAPEKAVEMYGVKSSSLVVSQFVEYAGSSMLSIAIASILALGGMDFATAVAWGFVPQCVLNVQGFLNDKMTKMGFGRRRSSCRRSSPSSSPPASSASSASSTPPWPSRSRRAGPPSTALAATSRPRTS